MNFCAGPFSTHCGVNPDPRGRRLFFCSLTVQGFADYGEGMASEKAHDRAPQWFSLNRRGSEGSPVLFVTGPPTSGEVFQRVQERLEPRQSIAIDGLMEPGEFEPEAYSRELKKLCEAEGIKVVVAHGLAVPLVLDSDLDGLELLILSNGPLSRLDPYTKALSKIPCTIMRKVILQPQVFNKWLASSVGLRRAVVNPYVMEQDTVEFLSKPYLESSEARYQTNRWIKSLPEKLPVELPSDTKVVAIWADKDFLYPPKEIEQFQGIEIFWVSGGRFLHPQERPWELGDACLELFEKLGV